MLDRITRAFWCCCAILWLSAGIIAAPPLTITRGGYWLTVVDAAGVPTLVKVDTIIDLTAPGDTTPIPPKPTPEDPQPPKVDFDLAVVRLVKSSAETIGDHSGALAIKAVYDHVAGAYSDGLLSETSVWSALKVATDDALTITSSSINWSEFRSSVSAVIAEAKQRGALTNKQQIEKMLASISQGLSMSADGKPSLSESQIVQIAVKTNEAIDAQ